MCMPGTVPASAKSQNEQKNIPSTREFLLHELSGVPTAVLVAVRSYSFISHNNLRR